MSPSIFKQNVYAIGNRMSIVQPVSQRANKVRINNNKALSAEQHKALLNALMDMLMPGLKTRDTLLTGYEQTARDLAAVLHNKLEEEQREEMLARGMSTSIPDQRYPTAQGQVDDIVTHLLTIMFPARQMYGSTEADPDEQNVANAFVTVMNKHAASFGHYDAYSNMLNDAMSYNRAGMWVEWKQKHGWVNHRKTVTGGIGASDVVISGNCIENVDIFNTIWDYTAPVASYGVDAQYVAKVTSVNEYQLEVMRTEGKLFGPDSIENYFRKVSYVQGKEQITDLRTPFYTDYHTNLGQAAGFSHTGSMSTGVIGSGLYKRRPAVNLKAYSWADDNGECYAETGRPFDYTKFLGNEDHNAQNPEVPHSNEILHIYVRISPEKYGLSNEKQLQIWEFKILNGAYIVWGAQASLAHGMLPVVLTVPRSEHGALQTKSIGQRLVPFQDLMSNVYNLYLKGLRKSVNNGLVFYDSEQVKLADMKDPTSGYVPVVRNVDRTSKHVPISNLIHTVHERPEINTTMRDIEQIKEMMQDVMPTDQLQKMGDLNRATDHQSRSVSNAASRRLFRLARTISDQSFAALNYMMTQLTIEHQDSVKIIDQQGKTQTIDPKQFRDSGIELAISDGLRGIDTISIANRISQIIQYALQSRQAQEKFDVIKMIEYLMHIEGATFNVAKFRLETPFDAMSLEEKNMAVQALQQLQTATNEGQ